MSPFDEYLETASREQFPRLAIFAKCRTWGIPPARASHISDHAAQHSYIAAFTKNIENPGYFNGHVHFRKWVFQSAVWYLMDELRKGGKGPGSLPLDLPGQEPSPEDGPISGERSAEEDCLSKLDPVETKIVHEMDKGRTLVEIGEILLTWFPELWPDLRNPEKPPSPSAAGQRVFRIKEKAKRSLGDCLAESGLSHYRRQKAAGPPKTAIAPTPLRGASRTRAQTFLDEESSS